MLFYPVGLIKSTQKLGPLCVVFVVVNVKVGNHNVAVKSTTVSNLLAIT